MRNACQCRSGVSSVDDHAAAPLCSGATRGIPLYSCIRLYTAIHGYTAPAGRALLREWSELDQPHSRPRACARVTMRVRIMRARARARARARGDTPWICSRINYGVEDYRRAVLGSSKNRCSGSSADRGIPLYSRSSSSAIRGIPLYSRVAAIPV